MDTRTPVTPAIGKIAIYAFLTVLAVLCLVPFYSMLINSSHTSTDISTKLLLLPGSDFLDNYHQLMGTINIWQGFLHSILIAVTSTLLALYFSALAAFGFAKYRFKGRNFLFVFVLGTMMIPGQLGIIGFFKLMNTFHFLNTYYPLILPSIANAFAIFFLRQICDSSVPDELLEAGRIDGAGELRMFHTIVLPLLGPSIATLSIFTFISKWNSFLEPLIIIFDNAKQTLPVMVAMTKGQFTTNFGAQYVGVVISVLPVLIVFAVASKRVISGITVGSLKG
ncbi:MAG TPA: carbohydrate ABC transporter permease [Mycobacteriales bacterium]|nr:carbohydrate ABC transporter permease [Mycobacteriales bacterium]